MRLFLIIALGIAFGVALIPFAAQVLAAVSSYAVAGMTAVVHFSKRRAVRIIALCVIALLAVAWALGR